MSMIVGGEKNEKSCACRQGKKKKNSDAADQGKITSGKLNLLSAVRRRADSNLAHHTIGEKKKGHIGVKCRPSGEDIEK